VGVLEYIRILICDVDGTILDKDFPLGARSKKAVRELQDKGLGVTLATGRNEWEARQVVQELRLTLPVILANGAQIYDFHKEQLIYSQRIKNLDVMEFLGDYADLSGSVSWYDGADWQTLAIGQFFKKCNDLVLKRILVDLPAEINMKSSCGSPFWVFRNGTSRYELTPKSAHKGQGLQHLCRILGILARDTVAIGNDSNDLSLLESAGIGLAVGDGLASLKKKADGVLVPLREEPIVAVAKWLLGELAWEDLVF